MIWPLSLEGAPGLMAGLSLGVAFGFFLERGGLVLGAGFALGGY